MIRQKEKLLEDKAPEKPPYDVFLVEDNEDDRFFTQRVLETSPWVHGVYGFSNAMDFVAYMEEHPQYSQTGSPALIIIDLNMPRMDGLTLLGKIKSNSFLVKDAHTIVLTGALSFDTFKQAMELDADGVFRKPMTSEKLESFFLQLQQEEEKEQGSVKPDFKN